MEILILLKRLWLHLSFFRRMQFIFLLFLMFVVSIAEVVSVGAVLPFLAVLTSPEKVFINPNTQILIQKLNISSPDELLLPMSIIFGLAAIFSGCLRILLSWVTIRFSYATGADLGVKIYHLTLHQAYAVHLSRNTSAVINGIIVKASGVINTVLIPTLSIISSSLILLTLLLLLVSIEPIISLIAFLSFGTVFALINWVTRVIKLKIVYELQVPPRK